MKTPLIIAAAAVAAMALAIALTVMEEPGDEAVSSSEPMQATLSEPAPAPESRAASTPEVSEDTPAAPASPAPVAIVDDARFPQPGIAATIAQYDTDVPTWSNAEVEDFEAFVGDTITVQMDDGRNIDFRIAEVIPGPEEPDRPEILPRSRSLSLVLSAEPGTLSNVAQLGARTVSVFHPALGTGPVMLGVYPNPDGTREAEIVLN